MVAFCVSEIFFIAWIRAESSVKALMRRSISSSPLAIILAIFPACASALTCALASPEPVSPPIFVFTETLVSSATASTNVGVTTKATISDAPVVIPSNDLVNFFFICIFYSE